MGALELAGADRAGVEERVGVARGGALDPAGVDRAGVFDRDGTALLFPADGRVLVGTERVAGPELRAVAGVDRLGVDRVGAAELPRLDVGWLRVTGVEGAPERAVGRARVVLGALRVGGADRVAGAERVAGADRVAAPPDGVVPERVRVEVVGGAVPPRAASEGRVRALAGVVAPVPDRRVAGAVAAPGVDRPVVAVGRLPSEGRGAERVLCGGAPRVLAGAETARPSRGARVLAGGVAPRGAAAVLRVVPPAGAGVAALLPRAGTVAGLGRVLVAGVAATLRGTAVRVPPLETPGPSL